MVAVIVLIDQIVWRPVIAWSERFKFEQVEASEGPGSPVLRFLRASRLLSGIARRSVAPAREALTLHFARTSAVRHSDHSQERNLTKWTSWILAALGVAGVLYAMARMGVMLTSLEPADLREIFWGAEATFLRIELTLVLAALWAIPAGVFIGLRPKFSAIAQPVAQIAASIPAPALFPIVLLLLIRVGGGLGIASIVLLLLGTQMVHPVQRHRRRKRDPFGPQGSVRDISREQDPALAQIDPARHFSVLDHWFRHRFGRRVECQHHRRVFRFRNQTFSITGLGAVISRATEAGNFPVLLGATVVISAMVATINRLIWRRLYTLASTRFKLEFT